MCAAGAGSWRREVSHGRGWLSNWERLQSSLLTSHCAPHRHSGHALLRKYIQMGLMWNVSIYCKRLEYPAEWSAAWRPSLWQQEAGNVASMNVNTHGKRFPRTHNFEWRKKMNSSGTITEYIHTKKALLPAFQQTLLLVQFWRIIQHFGKYTVLPRVG